MPYGVPQVLDVDAAPIAAVRDRLNGSLGRRRPTHAAAVACFEENFDAHRQVIRTTNCLSDLFAGSPSRNLSDVGWRILRRN